MKIELKSFNIKSYFRVLYLLLNPETRKDFSYSIPEYISMKLKEIGRKNRNYRFDILVNGKFAGFVGLVKTKDVPGYEIGYLVFKKFRNKGVASKSLSKLLEFAYKKINCNAFIKMK